MATRGEVRTRAGDGLCTGKSRNKVREEEKGITADKKKLLVFVFVAFYFCFWVSFVCVYFVFVFVLFFVLFYLFFCFCFSFFVVFFFFCGARGGMKKG